MSVEYTREPLPHSVTRDWCSGQTPTKSDQELGTDDGRACALRLDGGERQDASHSLQAGNRSSTSRNLQETIRQNLQQHLAGHTQEATHVFSQRGDRDVSDLQHLIAQERKIANERQKRLHQLHELKRYRLQQNPLDVNPFTMDLSAGESGGVIE